MKLTDFAQAHEFRIPLFWILSCVAVVASQSGAGEVTLSGISDRQFQNVSNNNNQRNSKSEGQGRLVLCELLWFYYSQPLRSQHSSEVTDKLRAKNLGRNEAVQSISTGFLGIWGSRRGTVVTRGFTEEPEGWS